jgi:hypothetical protein
LFGEAQRWSTWKSFEEIFAFVCFAMGVCSLILAVFQAWNGKVVSAAGLGIAFAVCAKSKP